MMSLPRLTERSALFLDFDGTLADLAPRPDAVVIPRELPDLLRLLHEQLGGALALVTGRPPEDVDLLLTPLRLPAAFEHGAIRRTASGALHVAVPPDLDAAIHAAMGLAAQHPALLVEKKRTAVALHYRQAPELEALCLRTMAAALTADAGLTLLRGKAVVEIKSASVDKGLAITAFMAEAPFAGRTPCFAGDDVTDEAGFESVQRHGGHGIKTGPGATVASHRCADPSTLRDWLRESARLLQT